MIGPLIAIYLFLLVVCFITGVICTRRLNLILSPPKLLPWFILLTIINEITALWRAIKYGNNHIVYNIYQIIQFAFFSFVLTLMIGNKRMRKLLISISIPFAAIATVNITSIQGLHRLNTINYYGGAIIISFFSGYALNELFRKAGIGSPLKMANFWICSSMLVQSSCMIPLLLPVAFGLPFTPGETQILVSLIMAVNYIAYSMFTLAFWRQYKNNERSRL